MKNLKTILLGIFTLIASTEMMYPIIFTGPGCRAAHRHEEQDAYAAGMADGAAGDMMAKQDQTDDSDDYSDVEVQMLSSGNAGGQEDDAMSQEDEAMSIDSDSSDSDSSYGTISVASGDASDDENQAANNLDQSFMVTPDNEDNFNDNLAYGDDLFVRGQAQEPIRQQVVAEQQENQNDLSHEASFDGYFIDQALQDAELDDDLANANNNIAINLFGNDNDSDSDDDVETQSIEPEVKASAIEDDAQVDHIVSEIKTEEVPAQLIATPALLAAPSEKPEEAHEEVQPVPVQSAVAVESAPVVAPVAKVEEIVTPAVQATPVAAPVQEQIKIIKVYPVYDALRSAVKAINNATHDMINYIYSFVK